MNKIGSISLIIMWSIVAPFTSAYQTAAAAESVLDQSSPLILKLGDDEAIDSSIAIIDSHVSNARIKEVSSQDQLLTYTRSSYSEVFYVGHGTPAGLAVNDQIMSWNAIKEVQFKGVKQYFVSCNSGVMDSPRAIGFAGEVDAELAASYCAIDYALTERLDAAPAFAEFMGIFESKMNGEQILPLYMDEGGGGGGGGGSPPPTPVWGTCEKIFAAIEFAIWAITTCAACCWAYDALRFSAVAIQWKIGANCVSIAVSILKYFLGQIDLWGLISSIFVTLVSIMWDIINYTAFWVCAAIATIFGAEVATGGWGFYLAIVIGVAQLAWLIYRVVNDANDANDIFGA